MMVKLDHGSAGAVVGLEKPPAAAEEVYGDDQK